MRTLLTDTDIQNALRHLNTEASQRWRLQEKALLADWVFADFLQAMAFMQEVAAVAHRSDHHPEWSNVYNRVEVLLTTHDAGGVTEKDVRMARFIDEAAAATGAK